MPANDALNLPESQTAAGAPVLVVEDDEDLRRLIHRVLDRQGYAVRTVAEGSAVQAALRQRPRPRLILIDADPAGVGGRQPFAAQRGHSWTKDIPVVYLTRPFSIDALRALVNDSLKEPA